MCVCVCVHTCESVVALVAVQRFPATVRTHAALVIASLVGQSLPMSTHVE